MKKFIPMMLLYITCIALQTNAMDLDKDANDKESTLSQQLLIPINTTTESENNKITTKQKNNYTTFPIPIAENMIMHLPMKLNTDKKENHDEIYEIISLDDTQKNDAEENCSSKCVRCCIPLTKEKIEELTKKKKDINLYRENKCEKRKIIIFVAIPAIILVSAMGGIFGWISTLPSCHNSNSSLSPCWDWIW
jgi:hypothetical protein